MLDKDAVLYGFDPETVVRGVSTPKKLAVHTVERTLHDPKIVRVVSTFRPLTQDPKNNEGHYYTVLVGFPEPIPLDEDSDSPQQIFEGIVLAVGTHFVETVGKSKTAAVRKRTALNSPHFFLPKFPHKLGSLTFSFVMRTGLVDPFASNGLPSK